jgi:DNA-binding CsgD family transcriptional regulator
VAGTLSAAYPAQRAYAAQTAAELAAEPYPAWAAAVDAWRADGQPYPLACALIRLAEAAAGAGDKPAAADAIAEAGQLAARLDAVPLAEKIGILARRLGLRAVEGAATADSDLLTARELEVLRLVAAVQSNRRIAAELFISPKTASVHVSRIIAKLAVSNRMEAAATAHRLGLLADRASQAG